MQTDMPDIECRTITSVSYSPLSAAARSEQWMDGAHLPSVEDVKWRSRRQESHPLPSSLNTIREEKMQCSLHILSGFYYNVIYTILYKPGAVCSSLNLMTAGGVATPVGISIIRLYHGSERSLLWMEDPGKSSDVADVVHTCHTRLRKNISVMKLDILVGWLVD